MRWSKKDIIYHILVDRFSPVDSQKAKKPVFAGGNIKGIIEHLPYFEDLGITALWLSPIYEGVSYHGYHITDFMKVDPHFGSIKDVQELIKEAHKKNIKIILDFVPNHISSKHYIFQEAHYHENAGFRKWFYMNKDDYTSFFDFKELPKLNLDHEATKIYITESAKYWLSLGVDGLRLDHVIGPSIEFWKYFVTDIKKYYPECLLIGEAWANNFSWKALKTTNTKHKFLKWITKAKTTSYMKDYEGILDGCLDFRFNELLREYIFEHKHKNSFAKDLIKHYQVFSKNYYLPVFLDNHDMDRFYFDCSNKEDYKKAIDLLFAQNQPVIIYYGDESGMIQEKHIREVREHGDLEVRQAMNWDNMDAELVEYWKKKIKERLTKHS